MTLLALVVAVTAGAQSSSWDPDYNADNIIGTDDLLGLLSVFGMDWLDDANILAIDSLDYTEAFLHIDTAQTGYQVYPIWNIEISEETDVVIITDLEYSKESFLEYASGFLPADAEIWASGGLFYAELPQNSTSKSMIVGFDDTTPPDECEWQSGDYLDIEFQSGTQDDVIKVTFHCIENDPELSSFYPLLRFYNRWLVNGPKDW